ncbi:MAG: TetR/AcrR family transcriptional regulator [Eubacteriales bacterium]|nr:TetR/AcrR family transcriptional regulator [Eubacteriales bacterium]
MPPKPKYTKDEIITAAYEIARERGIDAVVAREVGKKLGTSATPIFTIWKTMEELQEEVIVRAWQEFDKVLDAANHYNPPFKMRGFMMVKFAQDEPKIFQLLFMRERKGVSFRDFMNERIHGIDSDIDIIRRDYGATEEQARQLFEHVWIHTYGIAVLCATNLLHFTDQEIGEMLGQAFMSMIMLIKSGSKAYKVSPAKKGTPEGEQIMKGYPAIDKGPN